jgi:hypothetical protein
VHHPSSATIKREDSRAAPEECHFKAPERVGQEVPLFLQAYKASSQRNHKHDETELRMLSGMPFWAPDKEQLTTNYVMNLM